VEGLAGDRETSLAQLLMLTEVTDRIGTYHHLRAAPAWLSGDDETLVREAMDAGWLDGERFAARLGSVLPAAA
jgi:hypothetical protein